MKNQLLIPTLAIAAALWVGCDKQGVEHASNQFNKLPANVQKSIHDAAPNAEVADVNESKRDGLTVYEVKFRDSDRNPSIWVSTDGTVLRNDPSKAMGAPADRNYTATGRDTKDMGAQFSALPVAVQKAIQENAPKADVNSINRKEESGRIVYEIEYAGKGKNPSIQVSEDGTVTKPLSTNNVPVRNY